LEAKPLESTVVAFKCANAVAGAGKMALIEVIDPLLVEAILSCKEPISVLKGRLITHCRGHSP
jgi:hypothetical protein